MKENPYAKYSQPTQMTGENPYAKYATAEAPPMQEGVGRTVLDQGLQGATLGFADEVSDRLGAGIASLYTGENYSDMLQEAREMSKARMQRQFEQHPGVSIASNIAGGVLTGGAAATTKAGASLGNLLRSGNTGARIAKGAALGSASGGLYGAGAADDGKSPQGAVGGALLGATVGGAVPGIAAGSRGAVNAYKGFRARDVEALEKAGSVIKDKSTAAYTAMRDAGAVFKPQTSKNIIKRLETDLAQDGKLNARLHDKVIGLLSDMKKDVGKGNVTLEGLDQWRQLFGEVAGNYNDKINARKATSIIRSIDDVVNNLKPSDLAKGTKEAVDALQTGRSEYSRAMKFNNITDIIKKSDGDVNYLKRELKKLADNPKKTRGYTPDELEALNKAASLSGVEGILKGLGKFGVDLGSSRIGNTALPMLSGVAAGMSGGTGVGIAVPVAGTIARQGQKYLARGKAENLLKVIEQGGKIAKKDLTSLPAAEQKKFLNFMLSMPAAKARSVISIMQNTKE